MVSIFAASTFEGMSGRETVATLPVTSVTTPTFSTPILSRSWR